MSRISAPDAALAAAIRRLREERRISREALALDAGLATGTLARIELARADPGWSTVKRLARALGVSAADVARAAERAASVRAGEAERHARDEAQSRREAPRLPGRPAARPRQPDAARRRV